MSTAPTNFDARLSPCLVTAALAVLLPAVAHGTDPFDPSSVGPEILALEISAPRTALLVGETVQLTVEGTFADGTVRDVATDSRTVYNVFPFGSMTVDDGGLVQALAPADGWIVVTFQHYTRWADARFDLVVRAEGDSDADGLPDLWELEHQLDPDFPADAYADNDADALDNLEEFEYGTDPRLADTDGDLELDGMEVAEGTDPLVPERHFEEEPQPLNESCVVSVLNRTAPVDAEGAWILPNVPAGFGPVRVRATCVEDGASRSGQSAFFAVPSDGIVRVAEVLFESREPIPASLALTAPAAELTAVGETLQLTATARLPDGSSVDVTAAAAGTSYIVSSPAVATVGADGVLAAVASGSVLVSAVNEGALALLSLRVVLSGDSDGDGLPDDFELANGLDPNSAADAFRDPDRDGLTIGEEFELGLDPFDPDSDGDSLLDGREVVETGTDPLRFDSDGDLVSDGLEVISGSDPLDPASVNLAPILESMTVRPPTFTLIFNTVVGESSRRLQVTGTLIDGTVLDVTGGPYGTEYQSSDLTVASFGLDPGRVFAGRDGTATVTASNGGVAVQTEVTVRTFSPTALSFLRIPGFANGVVVRGEHAYVAAGERGLQIVDVSDLEEPFLAGSVDTPGIANAVAVGDEFVYVADGTRGLHVVDVSAPESPFLVASIETPGVATDLVLSGNKVLVADGPAGVRIFDVEDPYGPVLLGAVDTPGLARGIAVSGDYAVVADREGGVHVVDVGNPAAPRIRGSVHTRPNAASHAAGVAVRGRLAYVADGARASLGGLRVIDFRVPSTPVVVGSTSDDYGLVAVALEDGLAFAADYFFVNAVPIFRAATEGPVFNSALDFYGPPDFRDDNGNDVAVRDGVVFLAANRQLEESGGRGDGGLHIGRYLLLEDGTGMPPRIGLTAPAAGGSAVERSLVTVRADAVDDVRVAKVEFLTDGEVVHVDYDAPWEHTFRAPPGPATLKLGARATDVGGNQASAEEVAVQVVPDDRPTVDLLSPPEGGRFTEGVTISIAAEATDDFGLESVELLVDGVFRQVLTAEPYRLDYRIPIGAQQFEVSAVATDTAGQIAVSPPRVIGVDPDVPPSVAILEPPAGGGVVRGSRLRVRVAASDDLGVALVRLRVDDLVVAEDGQVPYELDVDVPAAGSQLRLVAEATDVREQRSEATVTVELISDPLTTVFGDVALDDAAIGGAEVDCLSIAGQSDAEGFFALDGVPTAAGLASCTAAFVDDQGTTFFGTSEAVPPVPGGITDVGTIRLTESEVIAGLGYPLALDDDGSAFVFLPFAFPVYGVAYSDIYVNANGTLTFDPTMDYSEDADEFVSGFRDVDDAFVGPTLAPFWDDLEPQPVVPERDVFRLSASAGDRVIAEVEASGAGSELDGVLLLFDSDGILLAWNDDFDGLDPRIDFVFVEGGTYFLQLEDLSQSGGPGYFYSLAVEAAGMPPAMAVSEVEPNGGFDTAMPLQLGSVVTGTVDRPGEDVSRNVFVDAKTPGRVVVTWNRVPEYPSFGANTVQAVLFDDGRIEYRYAGVTADDAIVGVSPSGGEDPLPPPLRGEEPPAKSDAFLAVDFSQEAPIVTHDRIAVFEEFDGPNGPDGRGEDPPGVRPFDLDGLALVFTPNLARGYDVHLESTDGASSSRPRLAKAEGAASEGVIDGWVLLPKESSIAELEILATSSADPAFEARVTIAPGQRFHVEGVPEGGVVLVAYAGDHPVSRGAGLVRPGDSLKIVLRPIVTEAE